MKKNPNYKVLRDTCAAICNQLYFSRQEMEKVAKTDHNRYLHYKLTDLWYEVDALFREFDQEHTQELNFIRIREDSLDWEPSDGGSDLPF